MAQRREGERDLPPPHRPPRRRARRGGEAREEPSSSSLPKPPTAMLLRLGAMAAAALLEATRSRPWVGMREPQARAVGTAVPRIDDESTGGRCI
jgi:hypothetical protein